MGTTIADVLAALELAPEDDGRFRVRNLEGPGQVVFGGQILAQVIVAADRSVAAKGVRSVHTIFARGASRDADLEVDVDLMHEGRAVASTTVTAHQGERLCSRSLVLLSAEEPDFIEHAVAAPAVAGPDESVDSSHEPWWETRIVGGVDLSDPSAVGPAELNVWSRMPGGPSPDEDQAINQALFSYATDGWLIATAMRPHEGVGQALAHRSISTSVLSHTLTFHRPLDAGAWILLAQESPSAGRGRSYGQAHAFSENGTLVASFVQENMIRPMTDAQPGKVSKY